MLSCTGGFRAESELINDLFSAPTPSVAAAKLMVLIDGTWFYDSLIKGCNANVANHMSNIYGPNWNVTHRLDYKKLLLSIEHHLRKYTHSEVKTVRTAVFIAADNTALSASSTDRVQMLEDMTASEFDITSLQSSGSSNCVDVALATEMLYMAAVPNALDVACLVTGSPDLAMSMQKTRLRGKTVCLVSIRSCSPTAAPSFPTLVDTSDPAAACVDVPIFWLEDHLHEFVTAYPFFARPLSSFLNTIPLPALEQPAIPPPSDPLPVAALTPSTASSEKSLTTFLNRRDAPLDSDITSSEQVVMIVRSYVAQSPVAEVSSRDVGRYLSRCFPIANQLLKTRFGGLKLLVRTHPEVFSYSVAANKKEFLMRLVNDADSAHHLQETSSSDPSFSLGRRQHSDSLTDLEDSDDGANEVSRETDGDLNSSAKLSSLEMVDTPSHPAALDNLPPGLPLPTTLPSSCLTPSSLPTVCDSDTETVWKRSSYPLRELVLEKDLRNDATDCKSFKISQMLPPPSSEVSPYSAVPSLIGDDASLPHKLTDLIEEYVASGRGNVVSSRDLGRYLSSVSVENTSSSTSSSALNFIKTHSGSVRTFLYR